MEMSILATAAFVILALPRAASAGEYTDQVNGQLAIVKLAALTDGWTETHNDRLDSLNSGQSDSFTFTLRRGRSYKVLSVCDEDCSDLDLTLYDEYNNKIGQDLQTDSLPIIGVNPRWTGKYRLVVKMYSCHRNPCYYGISILGK